MPAALLAPDFTAKMPIHFSRDADSGKAAVPLAPQKQALAAENPDQLFSKAQIDKFIDFLFEHSDKKTKETQIILAEYLQQLNQATIAPEKLLEIYEKQKDLYKREFQKTAQNPHPPAGDKFFRLLGSRYNQFNRQSFANAELQRVLNREDAIENLDPNFKKLAVKIFFALRASLANAYKAVSKQNESKLNAQEIKQKVKNSPTVRERAATAMLIAQLI